MSKDGLSLLQAVDRELRSRDENPLNKSEQRQVLEDNEDDYEPGAVVLVDNVVRRRRRRTQVARASDDGDDRSGEELSEFVQARSLLYAALADEEPDVRSFRKDALGGRLLQLEDVADWVRRRHALDGTPTVYLRVLAPTEWEHGSPVASGEVVGASVDFLPFPDGRGATDSVPVARGGVLDVLRVVGGKLSSRYEWQPAQATAYLLTGATPVVSMLTTTRVGGTNERLVLDVDPDTPVERVAAVFTDYRRAVLGNRARRPHEQGVRMVIHAALNPDRSGRALWRSWEAEHPEATPYPNVRSFNQALRNARRRVMGEPRS